MSFPIIAYISKTVVFFLYLNIIINKFRWLFTAHHRTCLVVLLLIIFLHNLIICTGAILYELDNVNDRITVLLTPPHTLTNELFYFNHSLNIGPPMK